MDCRGAARPSPPCGAAGVAAPVVARRAAQRQPCACRDERETELPPSASSKKSRRKWDGEKNTVAELKVPLSLL